jgi:ornithine cyclodeaminase/alanine dehydrogenase-like protein (mu-crystallin family)
VALVLREDDVRTVLTMADTVNVLEAAFRRQGLDQTRDQPRRRVLLPDGRGVLHTLSAFVPGEPGHPEREGLGLLGLKAYTTFREGVRFVVLLYSGGDGRLLALVEADWLGQMRTGAASGVATRYMARPEAATLGVIGTGQQSRTQLLAVCAVRPIQTVLIYGRDEARRSAFAKEMAERAGNTVRVVASAQEAVSAVDVVVTMTTARDTVLQGAWLQPGTHVNAAGANWATRREVDDVAVERSTVVAVDSVEQARLEAGDLVLPAAIGRFDWSRAVELGQIVAGQASGRPTPDAITLFKSVGIALEDVATAGLVYALARERGLGTELDILP